MCIVRKASFWDLTLDTQLNYLRTIVLMLCVPPLGRFTYKKCGFCWWVDPRAHFKFFYNKTETPKVGIRRGKGYLGEYNAFNIVLITLYESELKSLHMRVRALFKKPQGITSLDRLKWATLLHELGHVGHHPNDSSHGVMFTLRLIRVYVLAWARWLKETIGRV
jgi:hypothetical protein